MWDRAPPLCTTFLMTYYKLHQVIFSFNELILKESYGRLSAGAEEFEMMRPPRRLDPQTVSQWGLVVRSYNSSFRQLNSSRSGYSLFLLC